MLEIIIGYVLLYIFGAFVSLVLGEFFYGPGQWRSYYYGPSNRGPIDIPGVVFLLLFWPLVDAVAVIMEIKGRLSIPNPFTVFGTAAETVGGWLRAWWTWRNE